MRTTILKCLCPLALAVAIGCEGKTGSRVTGEVTYEGAPVAKGTITFLPADGKGQSVTGDITNGQYTVSNVRPGDKVVEIKSTKEVKFARSPEEMSQMQKDALKKGNKTGIIDPANTIPRNAEGNGQKVKVVEGDQTLDFALTKPTGAR